MVLLHLLSLLLGLSIAALLLGSRSRRSSSPRRSYPRLSQAVFALVHRLMVHEKQEAGAARPCAASTRRWRW